MSGSSAAIEVRAGRSKERGVALSRKTLWVVGAAALAVLAGLAFFGSYYAPLLGSAGEHSVRSFVDGHVVLSQAPLARVA